MPENAEIEIQAEIVSLKIKGEYKDKYIVKAKYGKRFYLYVNPKEEFDYGDIVEVKIISIIIMNISLLRMIIMK